MKPLLKPSSHSNLYHATMRPSSFGLPSRNQITRLDLRARCTCNIDRWKGVLLLVRKDSLMSNLQPVLTKRILSQRTPFLSRYKSKI